MGWAIWLKARCEMKTWAAMCQVERGIISWYWHIIWVTDFVFISVEQQIRRQHWSEPGVWCTALPVELAPSADYLLWGQFNNPHFVHMFLGYIIDVGNQQKLYAGTRSPCFSISLTIQSLFLELSRRPFVFSNPIWFHRWTVVIESLINCALL